MTDGYSFLRFLYTKYSEADYLAESWVPISECLKQVLDHSSENISPMSSQSIYGQIYKCACKGYKERLLDDVKKLVKEHCVGLKAQLDLSLTNAIDHRSNAQMNQFILQFIDAYHLFQRAVQAMVPLFHYLDVVYVKPKRRSTVLQELMSLYRTIVLEAYIHQIFSALQQSISTSDSPSRETIGSLLQIMNESNSESAMKQRDLFQRYCDGEDMPHEMITTDEEMIVSAPRTSSKRSVDDLPGDEDQPSAKRAMHTIKSPRADH